MVEVINGALHSLLTIGVLQAAVAGAVSAIAVDYRAFQQSQSYDVFATFSWKMAIKRYAQGAVAGVLAYYGLGAVV